MNKLHYFITNCTISLNKSKFIQFARAPPSAVCPGAQLKPPPCQGRRPPRGPPPPSAPARRVAPRSARRTARRTGRLGMKGLCLQ